MAPNMGNMYPNNNGMPYDVMGNNNVMKPPVAVNSNGTSTNAAAPVIKPKKKNVVRFTE
eukprot:CAMPEP_0176346146 /NCGR_PEP_ID=MMETSP0126-20121128/6016_1 /TAXON_ID=141414 ORGANISM="Strombidinopsis acuminatum, Strain SPMC142" /NCGR_SAMPLE_ID=MMETSP0126 /ASSEMBLY_ACC=CAM_ASM_000229 /LENGTH=58 /DNA_ID=CAMNT_0017693531 /DNA_START=1745 /DNA_END=1921 /DNA_ORIENTATION=+